LPDTPPSPIGRADVFSLALTWACLGKVDIVAVAPGKIIPSGRTKIIQPFETGVVRAIHVKDGQRVRAGDQLIDLDPAINAAEQNHLKADLLAAALDMCRPDAPSTARTSRTSAFPPLTARSARKARDIFVQELEAFVAKLAQRGVHVDRVPEHHGVDDQAESTELVFLALSIALPQLAALAVEYGPRQHVPPFTTVELHQNAAAVGLVVEKVEQVHRLDDAQVTSGGGCGGKGLTQGKQPADGRGSDTEPSYPVDPIGGCALDRGRAQTVRSPTFDPREEPGALAALAGNCAGGEE